MGSILSRCAGLALAVICGLASCDKGDDKPRQAPPNPPAPEAKADAEAGAGASAETSAEAPPAPGPVAKDKLLAWMDPDAVAVAYVHLPHRLRGDTVAVVYGLPPRAEDLLGAVADLDHALDAVADLDHALDAARKGDAPATDTWLSTEGLVTQGKTAQRPTVLHPLRVSHDEAITRIEALGLTRSEDDAFEVWAPQRVFPYKVVLLGEVAAFIPATELGGLLPLAAARDMPPSEAETQLSALLNAPSPPALALFAVGPMMHLDLLDDVLQAEFVLQLDGKGTLDGTMVLQVDGDAAAAVKTLGARKAPEQSDRIQELMGRVAYSVEQGAVLGRLQLPATDAALLYARSPEP